MLVPQTEITIALDGVELVRTVVEPGGYVIGADGAADIVAQAEGIARYHAHLTVTSDEMTIQDLGSESGTFVAGALAAESTRIWPNQKVLLGPAVLETRRLRTSVIDQSLPAPAVAVRRLLPEEFLRGRKYEIAGTLGQGGMGAVLRAHEATTHRTVAMKVMLANMSEADVVRFIAEAQITSQLEHPNIVPVHELGVDEHDQVFYTMKMVQGVTLREVLDKLRANDPETYAAYPLRRLLVVLLRVCEAVSFAHSRGVIHRDLKPDNVMIGDFGEVLVMDWGLAKVLGTPEPSGFSSKAIAANDVVAASGIQGDSFTRAGAFVGTPHYMSPEQARGESENLDVRADVWALGAILRHILCLLPPVPGQGGTEIMAHVRAGELQPIPTEAPHCPGGRVPESLTAVAQKAQAMDREQRYPSAVEFRKEIDAYLGGFATRAEGAGAMRQFWLLVKRHRAVSSALLVLIVVCVVFVVRLIESEHRAELSAQIARTNEVFAQQKELTARHAREVAQQENEAARKALANSQIAVADAAYRESNSRTMLAALNSVPEDLRNPEWRYLFPRADNSQARVEVRDGAWYVGAAADPLRPGVFAAATIHGEIALVDAKTGAWLSSFKVLEQQRKNIWFRGLDFCPQGDRIVVGSMGDGVCAVYRASDGQCLSQWPARGVDTVQFDETGDLVLTVDDQIGLSIREAATGTERGNFPGCLRAAWAPGGKAIVSQGGTLRVVDPTSHQAERDLYIGHELITSLSMPLGAKALYFTTTDGMVRGLNFSDGRVCFAERLTDRSGWLRVASSSRYIVASTGAADRFRGLRAWDARTGLPLPPLLGGVGNIEGLAIHPLSEEIMVSGVDTRIWNIGTRPPQWSFFGSSNAGVFWQEHFFPGGDLVHLDADGRTSTPAFQIPELPLDIRVAAARGDFAAVGKPTNPGPAAKIMILQRKGDKAVLGHTLRAEHDLRALCMSPAGDRLALRDFYAGLVTWNTVTGERLPDCNVNGVRTISDFTWIGSDRLAAVILNKERGAPGYEERIMLWDTTTGRRLQDVPYEAALDSITVSPDGRTLAEAGADKNVRLRDAETLKVREGEQFRAHDGPITALAYHPSKPILATASADLTVRLWNLSDHTLIEEIRSPGKEPASLHFNETGDLLACSDVAGNAFVWDLRLSETDARERAQTTESVAEELRRSDASARQAHWAEARISFGELVRLQPENSQHWFQLAPLLVQLGEHEAYRRHCHEMLVRFGDSSDPLMMERTAKACLLEPIDPADIERARHLGEVAAAQDPGHFAYLYFQFAKALGQYRTGAYAAASETLRVFQKIEPHNAVDIHARAVQAMALFCDHHPDEARTKFAEATAAAAQVLPREGLDQTDSWHDFLSARLLLREAAAVVEQK